MTPTGPLPDLPKIQYNPPPREKDPAPDAAEVLHKRVYMGFAGIVALGLALGGLYVAGRLFASPKAPHEAVAQVVKPTAKPVPLPGTPKPSPLQPAQQELHVAATPAPEPAKAPVQEVAQAPIPNPVQPTNPNSAQASAQAHLNVIAPKPGEEYLQLAALSQTFAERYVTQLEEKGIHASIAPGPSEDLYRVVVGPLAGPEAAKRQRDVLEAAGIQPIQRIY